MTKKQEKIFEELGIQAKALGFDFIDIYVPNKKTDEVVAITFSKSEEYVKKIRNIELEAQNVE